MRTAGAALALARATPRPPEPKRLLSWDEAEIVLAHHFRPASVSAQVLCGSFLVSWDDVVAESHLSFEHAVRELARRHPQLLVQPLDEPDGAMRRMTAWPEPQQEPAAPPREKGGARHWEPDEAQQAEGLARASAP